MGPLQLAFTRPRVRQLAGAAVYGRGVDYARQERVEPEAAGDRRLRATVRGAAAYTVELWVEAREPGWSCTCPYAAEGAFCKHAVAVALLLDPGGREADEGDPRLRERPLADAPAGGSREPDMPRWRGRIDVAFTPTPGVPAHLAWLSWGGRVEELVDELAELCDAGHPQAAAVLAEHAHRRADEAIAAVDDLDDWLTEVSARLAELHLRACRQDPPEPVELAGRLVDLELTSPLDGFPRAAETYAEVLGAEGLAAFRRRVAPLWEALGSRYAEWPLQRIRLREAMIGLALASGDPDELIGAYRQDLHTQDAYLAIARALAAAGRDAEAEGWAREGLEARDEVAWPTPPLQAFLVGLLRSRGEEAAALEVFLDALLRSPSLTAYRRLLAEAGDEAPAMRQRALSALTERLERPADGATRADPALSDALVEILAAEGQPERARQVATHHGCSRRVWLALAPSLEATHPLEAADVYELELRALPEAGSEESTEKAVDFLARLRRLATAAGQPERFDNALFRVRLVHGRKPGLMRRLEAQGW